MKMTNFSRIGRWIDDIVLMGRPRSQKSKAMLAAEETGVELVEETNEWDRQKRTVRKRLVSNAFSLYGAGKVPTLSEWDALSQRQCDGHEAYDSSSSDSPVAGVSKKSRGG